MGGIGAPAPKTEVDDAFGELFGETKAVAKAALPTQIQTVQSQAMPSEVVATVAPITQENDDGFDDFGDFGDFEGAGTTT